MSFWLPLVLWLAGLAVQRWLMARAYRAAGMAWTWAHDLWLALLWPAVLVKSLYDMVKTWPRES